TARRMDPIGLDNVPDHSLLLMDSGPIIYWLEEQPKLALRFRPLFAFHAGGRLRLAVTTIRIAEGLTGHLEAGNGAHAGCFHADLKTWQVVELPLDIAENAARLRASLRLKLADAIQAASALAINAAALVTHDRDFSRVRPLRVIS